MKLVRKIVLALLLALPAGQALALAAGSIPIKIPVYWGTGAQPGFITCPVPTPSQIGVSNGRASWTDGFPPLTFTLQAAGGVPPFGQDMNGVLCQISQWSRWFQSVAWLPYDATFQNAIGGYPQGAIVASLATSGLYWQSTVDNNTSDPDTGGAGWIAFSLTSSLTRDASISGAFSLYATDQTVGLTSSAASNSTLPSSVANGYALTLQDLGNNFSTYNVTINAPAGTTILGASNVILNVNGEVATFTYHSATSEWSFSAKIAAFASATFGGNGAGSGNAQTVSIPNVSSLGDLLNADITYIVSTTNSGATTLKVNTLTAEPVKWPVGTAPAALSGGELQAGQVAVVKWDGTEFLLQTNYNVRNYILRPPGGRLTLVAGVPVLTPTSCSGSNCIGQTAIYYGPYQGGVIVPIYNGTRMQMYQFTSSDIDSTGLTLTLGSNWAANTNYRVFVTLSGGSATLCTVAWSTQTSGAPALAFFDGFETNSGVLTCRTSNSATISLAANQGTWLGDFYTNGNTGQVDFNFGGSGSGGVAASLGLWNAYNQVPIFASTIDTEAFYTYSSSTIREAGASAGNQISYIIGSPNVPIQASYTANSQTGTVGNCLMGMNINSSTAFLFQPFRASDVGASQNDAGASDAGFIASGLGLNTLYALEQSLSSSSCHMDFSSLNVLQINLGM